MKENIGQIEQVISGELLSGCKETRITGVSTDSRKDCSNTLFFALRGERFDAHAFLDQAVSHGAAGLVVSDADAVAVQNGNGLPVILVEDTTKALQELAKWYLRTLKVKKIGITGSTGKTTTKDILYHICSEKFKTAKTQGNLNNHIGLPLTILSFEADDEVAVMEMGTEQLGEIRTLAEIAQPDIAIITNIGVMHMETFGTRENILKGKMEIVDYFTEENLLIVNEESDLLSKENVSGRYRLETLGSTGKSAFILSGIQDFGEEGVEFWLEGMGENYKFKLEIPGRHNAVNASLAIMAAMELGMTMEETARGVSKVTLTEKRLSIKGKDGIKVIDDTYNAGPDSMKAGIDVLIATKGMRKVAVLGDMLALGDEAEALHREVGTYAAEKGIGLLIAIGENAEHIAQAASQKMTEENIYYFTTKESFIEKMKRIIAPGDVVLVKGSRGMAMEQIVKKIME